MVMLPFHWYGFKAANQHKKTFQHSQTLKERRRDLRRNSQYLQHFVNFGHIAENLLETWNYTLKEHWLLFKGSLVSSGMTFFIQILDPPFNAFFTFGQLLVKIHNIKESCYLLKLAMAQPFLNQIYSKKPRLNILPNLSIQVCVYNTIQNVLIFTR